MSDFWDSVMQAFREDKEVPCMPENLEQDYVDTVSRFLDSHSLTLSDNGFDSLMDSLCFFAYSHYFGKSDTNRDQKEMKVGASKIAQNDLEKLDEILSELHPITICELRRENKDINEALQLIQDATKEASHTIRKHEPLIAMFRRMEKTKEVEDLVLVFFKTIYVENQGVRLSSSPSNVLFLFVDVICRLVDVDKFDNGVPNLTNRIKQTNRFHCYNLKNMTR